MTGSSEESTSEGSGAERATRERSAAECKPAATEPLERGRRSSSSRRPGSAGGRSSSAAPRGCSPAPRCGGGGGARSPRCPGPRSAASRASSAAPSRPRWSPGTTTREKEGPPRLQVVEVVLWWFLLSRVVVAPRQGAARAEGCVRSEKNGGGPLRSPGPAQSDLGLPHWSDFFFAADRLQSSSSTFSGAGGLTSCEGRRADGALEHQPHPRLHSIAI